MNKIAMMRGLRSIGLLGLLSVAPLPAAPFRFVSPHYVFLIEVRCPEGCVTCDDVICIETDRKEGRSVVLRGETVHSYSADGTPTQFQGYQFRDGSLTYFVSEHDYLEVRRGQKDLLYEAGTWELDLDEPAATKKDEKPG